MIIPLMTAIVRDLWDLAVDAVQETLRWRPAARSTRTLGI